MGYHRFRLANMLPNAWFYKFKETNKSIKPISNTTRAHPNPTSPTPTTSRSRTHTNHNSLPNQITPSRASYYFPSNSPIHPKALDTHFPPESPRKSSKKPRRKPISPRPIISTTTTTTTTTCSSSRNSTSDSNCSAVLHCASKITSSADDIIFDVGEPEMELPPPIVTKKKKNKKKEQLQQKKRRSGNCGGNAAANSPARLRTSRASSPWLVVAKKVRAVQRANLLQHKSLSESMVVVKNSSDPRKDFRDSMMEMVRENNLRASNDLEELLACYLSLNSDEHHDVIVKAFEDIWFDVSKNVSG